MRISTIAAALAVASLSLVVSPAFAKAPAYGTAAVAGSQAPKARGYDAIAPVQQNANVIPPQTVPTGDPPVDPLATTNG